MPLTRTRGHLETSGDLVVALTVGGATGLWWVETRDPTQPPECTGHPASESPPAPISLVLGLRNCTLAREIYYLSPITIYYLSVYYLSIYGLICPPIMSSVYPSSSPSVIYPSIHLVYHLSTIHPSFIYLFITSIYQLSKSASAIIKHDCLGTLNSKNLFLTALESGSLTSQQGADQFLVRLSSWHASGKLLTW